MAKIQGKDVNVQISTNGGLSFLTLICEITNSISLTRNTNSVATKCDSGTNSIALGSYSWEVSGEAAVDDSPTGSQATYADLLTLFVNGTSFVVQIKDTTSSASEYFHKGNAYVTALELTNQVDGVSQFTFTFLGDGAVDISYP